MQFIPQLIFPWKRGGGWGGEGKGGNEQFQARWQHGKKCYDSVMFNVTKHSSMENKNKPNQSNHRGVPHRQGKNKIMYTFYSMKTCYRNESTRFFLPLLRQRKDSPYLNHAHCLIATETSAHFNSLTDHCHMILTLYFLQQEKTFV